MGQLPFGRSSRGIEPQTARVASRPRPGLLSFRLTGRSIGLAVVAAIGLAGAVCVCSGCGEAGGAALPAPKPPQVRISPVEQREIIDYAEYTARTAAIHSVELRAQVAGYLTKVNFEAGQEVEAGHLLFQIDERPFKAALDVAQAEVKRLDAIITKNLADVARRKTLLEKAVIPQEEFDQAVEALAVSEASKAGALAAVENAQLNLDYTRITAPVTGRVGRALITEGNLVSPGSAPESLLTTLVSMDPIYVYFDIDEQTLLNYLRRGRAAERPEERGSIKNQNVPVEVSLAGDTDFPHKGVLQFVDNQVNTATGTLQARAELENPDRFLKIGLYARVRLPASEKYQAVVVPETAIGTDQSRRYVLVVGDQNIVESRTVTLGRRQPDGTRVVASGLKGDEQIVVDGLLRARPGLPVTPISTTEPHHSKESAEPVKPSEPAEPAASPAN